MSVDSCLRDQIYSIRPDARSRDTSLFFDPAPLFVVLAPLLPPETLQNCMTEVIGDGHGDPNGLDPDDEEQTSRLESVILGSFPDLSIEELITIDYLGWPFGLQESLCFCTLGSIDLLLMNHSHDIPAFMAFALGSMEDMLNQIRCNGDVLLPQLFHEDTEIVQIVVRKSIPWKPYDVINCVQNLTGTSLQLEQLLGTERLLSVS